MRIVNDIKSRRELNEMKSVMEIFVVNSRIRQLAKNA